MPLRALIFDVDGTLADTERHGHRVAFNEAFAKAGLDWHWNETLYEQLLTVTGGKERIAFYLHEHHPEIDPTPELRQQIVDLHRSKTAIYTAMLASGRIPLRPGVRRLLGEARTAGVRLAIATTTTPENVTALLESTLGPEGPGLFELIAAGDIVPEKKPAPDIYDYVLDTMNLEPEQAIAIEDSAHGLTSALSAGIRTIVTVNDYTLHQDFFGAALVLDSLGEPESPFRLIAGALPAPTDCVDLALLRRLITS